MPDRLVARRTLLALVLVIASLVATALPAQASGTARWDCIAHYESSGRWHINTGNGYYGGLQFSLSTWRYYGGPRYSNNVYPHLATKAEQIVIAKRVAWSGWGARAPQGGRSAWPNTWPRCD